MTSNLKTAELAEKLLELFGPNGEHWIKRAYSIEVDDEPGDYCIAGGCAHLGERHGALDAYLPEPWQTSEAFNDGNGWPSIKSWLEKLAARGGAEGNPCLTG